LISWKAGRSAVRGAGEWKILKRNIEIEEIFEDIEGVILRHFADALG